MQQEVLVILDRSGSMASIVDDAIGGFNAFLAAQQREEENALFSLVLFDHEYVPLYASDPIRGIPPLGPGTYIPRGSTALLDAIGRSLIDLKGRIEKRSADDRPESVVVAILTDGMENSSVEFSAAQVHSLIEQRKHDDGWQFVFLAANQDAIATAASMAIAAEDAFGFDATSEGIHEAAEIMSSAVHERIRRPRRSED